jgi:RimJ/RimL family protein N-acetyltransferase
MAGDIIDGERVGHWVAAQTGGAYHAQKSQAIGLVRDGQLVAGVIYENWNGKSIICHIAFLGRLSKEFLGLVYRYPYVTCGVEKIIAPISSDNEQALRLVQKMGFTEEARLKGAAPGGDIVFLTLARTACRFLEDRYGQISSSTTAG